MPWAFFNSSGELQINDGGVLASAAVFTGNADLGSNLLVGNAGSTGIAISANGEVTMAAQPSVLAYNSATDSNVTGAGTQVTVDFNTEIFDQNSDFASDTFTAPVTGRYVVSSQVFLDGKTTAGTYMVIELVSSNRTYAMRVVPDATFAAGNSICITSIVDMDAADTVVTKITGYGESSDVQDVTGGATMNTYLGVHMLA